MLVPWQSSPLSCFFECSLLAILFSTTAGENPLILFPGSSLIALCWISLLLSADCLINQSLVSAILCDDFFSLTYHHCCPWTAADEDVAFALAKLLCAFAFGPHCLEGMSEDCGHCCRWCLQLLLLQDLVLYELGLILFYWCIAVNLASFPLFSCSSYIAINLFSCQSHRLFALNTKDIFWLIFTSISTVLLAGF